MASKHLPNLADQRPISPVREVWQAYDCPVCVTDFDLEKDQLVYEGKTFTCIGCGKELVAGVDVRLETGINVRAAPNESECDQRIFVELPESEEALQTILTGPILLPSVIRTDRVRADDARNDAVLGALGDTIRRQERIITQLQADLEEARQGAAGRVLGQLRLREAVLLYVGQDADNFAQQLAEALGIEVARAVSASLFVLDNAPVSVEVRETIRKATNRGMNRW